MSARALLQTLRAMGFSVLKEGDRLGLKGPRYKLSSGALDLLREQKEALLEALDEEKREAFSAKLVSLLGEETAFEVEERLAILEFDAGFDREQAEAAVMAWAEKQ